MNAVELSKENKQASKKERKKERKFKMKTHRESVSNFTVNCCFELDDQQVNRMYTCRSFDHYEDGTFVLRGFNGSNEEVRNHCNDEGAKYNQIYVMNMAGNTIDSHDINK